MQELIKEMAERTDCWPWYWVSCGEKDYCFQVVEAYPLNEKDEFPKPGSQLEIRDNPRRSGDIAYFGENDVEMIVEQEIAGIESQNGDIICQFIAGAHAELMKDYLYLGETS